MDGVNTARLEASCAALFGRALDPDDPSVWFIRRLSFECLIDAGAADPDALAQFYGERIVRSVLRTMSAGPDGGEVLRFADWAAYLAAFICDLLAGRAWQQWHYRGFDGLRHLPPGAAIREALAREPRYARPVLLRLDRLGQTPALLAALSETDARLLHGYAATSAPVTDPAAACRLLPDAWPALPAGEPGWSERVALRLAIRTGWAAAPEPVRDFVAAMALLSAAAGSPGPLPATSVDPAWEQRGLTLLLSLQASAPDVLERMASAAVPSPRPAAAETAVLDSLFTTVFLLVGPLSETAPAEVLASPLLRLLVLAKCMGGARARLALLDPVIRLAAGLEDPLAEETAWPPYAAPISAALTPAEREYLHLGLANAALDEALNAVALQTLRAWTRRLPGFHDCTLPFLYENFFAGHGSVVMTSEGLEVRLPAAPLRLVLRLAGTDGATFEIPWGRARRVVLHLPQE